MGNRRIFDGNRSWYSDRIQRRSFLKNAGSGRGGGDVRRRRRPAHRAGGRAAGSAAAIEARDLDILNYALTLEYLESDFYAMGLQAGLLSGRELELVTPIGDHEKEHVTAVTASGQVLRWHSGGQAEDHLPGRHFRHAGTAS